MTWTCYCGNKVRGDKCKVCKLSLREYINMSDFVIRPAEESTKQW
jgi:7-cyano-7-deazaguanine synthase in queuosine biosynthesis